MMKTCHKPGVMFCWAAAKANSSCLRRDWAPATQGTSYIMIDKPKHRFNWRQCAGQAYPHETNITDMHTFIHTLCMNKRHTQTHFSHKHTHPFRCRYTCSLLFFLSVSYKSFSTFVDNQNFLCNEPKNLCRCIIWLHYHANNTVSATRGEQLVQLPVQMWPVLTPPCLSASIQRGQLCTISLVSSHYAICLLLVHA